MKGSRTCIRSSYSGGIIPKALNGIFGAKDNEKQISRRRALGTIKRKQCRLLIVGDGIENLDCH
jgi:hypothetical protein